MRSSLAEKARAKLLQIQIAADAKRCTDPPPLLEYFVEVSPDWERPVWLAPYANVLERAIGGNFRVAIAAPPQHGKTELTLRALLYWARFFPGKRHAYVTFNQDRADEVSKDFRRLAEEAGFHVSGTLRKIVLNGKTTIKFTSVLGTLTGAPVDGVCIIDDPIGNREDAFSPTMRAKIIGWWRSVARARRHEGTSFVVMATRWHPEDFTGYAVRELGWTYINLKAIAEVASNENDLDSEGRIKSDPLHRFPGESLWPAKRPPEFFKEEREDKFNWATQYQGEPRPEGGHVFNEPGGVDENGQPNGATFYTELPKDGIRGAFGLDLAYTSKTQADWSVCIEGVAVGKKVYIVDVVRKQVESTSFLLTLKAKQSQHPTYKFRWYHGGGGEKGVVSFIRKALKEDAPDTRFIALPAVADKRVRALPVARAWNRGNVVLPDTAKVSAPWVPLFIQIVTRFTGDEGEVDDDVDALAALFDQLMKKNPMLEALERRMGKAEK